VSPSHRSLSLADQIFNEKRKNAIRLDNDLLGTRLLARDRARRYLARMIDIEKRRASWARYNTSPKGRERARDYRLSPKGREAKLRYVTSPKGQETVWQYARTIERQAAGSRHTMAAREREQIKRRTKAREAIAASTDYRISPARRERARQKLLHEAGY
jgi:hypothetical protein